MELGKDVSSSFRAKNFLGCFSVRNGMFLVSFSQLLFGVALYCTLHYVHPSLVGVKWFLLGLHVLVFTLGFLGALRRSMTLHVTYLVFYALSMVFVSMVALDMSELVHFFPKAPEMHDFSLLGTYTPFFATFRVPNSRLMYPFSFYKEPYLYGNVRTYVGGGNFGKGHLVAEYSLTEVDLHDHKKCRGGPKMAYETKYEVDPVDANAPNGSMNSKDLEDLKNALKERLKNLEQPTALPLDSPAQSSANADSGSGDKGNLPTKVEKKEDSLYDHLPFLPHPGETEGESEEVSKDELPPETNDLSQEGKSEVVVMYKLQKRHMKFAASAFIMLALLFYLYSYWVAVTFALNKCTCLDELSAQPDQFTPLVD